MEVLGIDEAGRGPVIGPLVIAGVQIRQEDEQLLKTLGVTDSKLLTPKKREELEKEIKKIAKNVRVIIIHPEEIDRKMSIMSLNQIEMDAMICIINSSGACKTIIDLPSTSRSFREELESKIKTKTKITAEHKADLNHVIVGAASIIAKTERDRHIKALEKKHEVIIGSGYPGDPETKKHLNECICSRDTLPLPDYIRKSWQTTKDLITAKSQKALNDF